MAGVLKDMRRKFWKQLGPRKDREEGEGTKPVVVGELNGLRNHLGEEDGRGGGLVESPSALLTMRMERYKDDLCGFDTGEGAFVEKKLPTRAVGYESEAAVIDKEERRLIRVARLANRGARGNAEACEELESVLFLHVSEIQEEMQELSSLLKKTCATVEQLPDVVKIDFSMFAMPKTDFDHLGEEDEEHYFRMLDFETGIWELEAMITEHGYHQAVSIVEDLQRQSAKVNDAGLLARLESATEILCKELQPRGDSSGCASHYSQLLVRLNRPNEARRILLDDAALGLQVKLKSIQRGGGTAKFLRSVAKELYSHLCDALQLYKKLTVSDANALPVYMAWFVAELDKVYDEIIGGQIRSLKEFKLLAGCVDAVLSSSNRKPPSVDVDDLHAIYSIRMSELLREDVCTLLQQERKRIMEIVAYSVRHEKWELTESLVDEIVEKRIVKIPVAQKVTVAQSCRVLCVHLRQILQTVSTFRLEGIYVELVRSVLLPIEAYAEELSRQKKPAQMKANYLVLATVFVPYAIASLEESLSYAVPEVDQLRRRLLGEASLCVEETNPSIVSRRTNEVMSRGPSVSRWKIGSVDSYQIERDLSRKSLGDDTMIASVQQNLIRELVRKKLREERTKKSFM